MDYASLVENGAQILDVRSRVEFKDGSIKGSINIPVRDLPGRLSEIRREKPVITCCAGGVRSGVAKRILEAGGFGEVYNGGGWRGLKARLKVP